MPCPVVTQFCLRKRIASVSLALPMPVTDALLLTAITSGDAINCTFDRGVELVGFPGSWVLVGGGEDGNGPISAVVLSAVVISVVWASGVLGWTALRMTPYDPAIRTVNGGFAVADAWRA